MRIPNPFAGLRNQIAALGRQLGQLDRNLTLLRSALGRIEARQLRDASAGPLTDHEFQVFSQWGEDGIIQRLIREVPIARKLFVEFGVETYVEANTRFLLTNDNWSGLILDGSAENIRAVKREPLYWRHNLKAVEAFITRENINDLLEQNGVTGEIGLLSVDVDGNDYWIWEAITVVSPALVVVEYNARFGPERAVTVPYQADFVRGRAHPSTVYYGASLAALVSLGRRKGYSFVGGNSAGNNAFFVRSDLRPASLPEITAAEGFRACQFREGRDAAGRLLFLSPAEEAALIKDLPVVEVGEIR